MAKNTTEIHDTLEQYMTLPYRMEVYWDETYWAAEFPELPGLVAGHETWDGLLEEIQINKRNWFESHLVNGDRIPAPAAGRQANFSGKLVLRLPKSLHGQAAAAAERECVSLNTLILTAIATELGKTSPKV